MLNLHAICVSLVLLATVGVVASADTPSEPTPLVLTGKTVQRQEVSSSLIGFTSTTVFYTLDDHRVVVVIHIDNTKQGFPVTGKVCQFGKDVAPEAIAKWLNNQYSDALYPDVPEPKSTSKLPAEACQSLESKLLGQETVNDITYNQYRVEIKLAAVKVNDQFRLQEHKDTVKVSVVAK